MTRAEYFELYGRARYCDKCSGDSFTVCSCRKCEHCGTDVCYQEWKWWRQGRACCVDCVDCAVRFPDVIPPERVEALCELKIGGSPSDCWPVEGVQ